MQIYEIIGFVYQYLKLLRQVPPQEWIYKELQDIANLDFTFAEEQPQDEYASELSGVLVLNIYSLFASRTLSSTSDPIVFKGPCCCMIN